MLAPEFVLAVVELVVPVPELETVPLVLPVLEELVVELDPEMELALVESGWFFFHFFRMLENLKVLS